MCKDFNVKISLTFFDQKIFGSRTHIAGEIKQWYLLLGEGNAILVVIIGFQHLSAVFIGKTDFQLPSLSINIQDSEALYDNARDPWWLKRFKRQYW